MTVLEPHAETRRALGRLRDVIVDADVPLRGVEARAGFSPGYLSQLLAGSIDLKVRHVLAVLDAVDVSPARFFGDLYPPGNATAGPEPLVVPANHDIASVYSFGIESLERLRQRLERCEDVLSELHDTGVLEDD